MDYRPRLRPHVRLVREDDTAALIDDLFERRLSLEAPGAAFIERLDGRPLSEAMTSTGDEVLTRRLLLLNLVEGAGDGVVERVRRVRSGEEELGLSLLDGARFSCQGSGECCQNYVFGPLEDDDIARLEELDLATAFPHLQPPYIDELTLEDGQRLRYLRSVDDRCVFLDDDLRCGLHKRFGAASKPKLCRLYPLEHLATFDGLRVYDKGSCATFAVSARSGLPLVDDLERIRPLLPATVEALHHPIVSVDEFPCDYGHFDRLVRAGMSIAKRGLGDGPATLRALGRGLRHFAETLRSFPLAPGQPDAAIDTLLATDPAHWFEGTPRPEEVSEGAYRLSQMFSTLLGSVSGAIGRSSKEKGYLSQRLLREAAQLFHVAGVLAMRVADPRLPLDPYFSALARIPLVGDDVHDVLRLSIRQQLFGMGILVEGHALAGLLRMVLSQILAVAGARLRAVNEGRAQATASDLSWGHMLAARVLRRDHAAPLLLAAEGHFSSILEALPALVSLAPAEV